MPEMGKWDVNDPEVRRMVEQVKQEIAREFGVQVPPEGYLGHISSRQLGKIGSQLRKRIPILLAHQQKRVKTTLKKRC